MDGGIRRGSDVVKAVALGARAVMIGRAYLWGLAANGQAGVENVLDVLRGGIDSALLGHGALLDPRPQPRRPGHPGRVPPRARRLTMSSHGRELAEVAWTELPERPLVLVPVGSTEQHGPHLPLETDTLIATAVARELAERLGGYVAPAVASAPAASTRASPACSRSAPTPCDCVLVELVRSLSLWAGRVVLVNGHGGNLEAVTRRRRAAARRGPPGRLGPLRCREVTPTPATPRPLCCCTWRRGSSASTAPQAGNTRPIAELLPALRAHGVRAVVAQRRPRRPHRRDRRRGRRAVRADGGDCRDVDFERVALVTGAARGIGAATVAELCRQGYAVTALDACSGGDVPPASATRWPHPTTSTSSRTRSPTRCSPSSPTSATARPSTPRSTRPSSGSDVSTPSSQLPESSSADCPSGRHPTSTCGP